MIAAMWLGLSSITLPRALGLASLTILVALFASATAGISPLLYEWGWISTKTLFLGTATSAMDDITFWNFTLPVLTIALYGITPCATP